MTINKLGFYLVMVFSLAVNVVFAKEKIATVSPISYSLTKTMVQGTDIKVSYLPPTRLPINRVASWLRKNSSHRFDSFDAFVGISAVMPELNFHPSLRQSNIRIVDIDIAQAIMPKGEKIVQASTSEYFWLNSNNLLVMLGILKRDLSALWPQHAIRFTDNYQAAAARVRQINLKLDDLLMSKDIAFIVPLNDKLSPYVASLTSDTSSKKDALDLGLNYVQIASGKNKSATLWYIDDFSRVSDKLFIERIQSQVEKLENVLNELYH